MNCLDVALQDYAKLPKASTLLLLLNKSMAYNLGLYKSLDACALDRKALALLVSCFVTILSELERANEMASAAVGNQQQTQRS
jgi:hypothetical protein